MVVDFNDPTVENQLLWFVHCYGDGQAYIDAVRIKHTAEWGAVVWGYSVYRRSPGFRTIGSSIETMKREGMKIYELHDNLEEAVARYMELYPRYVDIPALRKRLTPSVKFLKKSEIRHNLSLVI